MIEDVGAWTGSDCSRVQYWAPLSKVMNFLIPWNSGKCVHWSALKKEPVSWGFVILVF